MGVRRGVSNKSHCGLRIGVATAFSFSAPRWTFRNTGEGETQPARMCAGVGGLSKVFEILRVGETAPRVDADTLERLATTGGGIRPELLSRPIVMSRGAPPRRSSTMTFRRFSTTEFIICCRIAGNGVGPKSGSMGAASNDVQLPTPSDGDCRIPRLANFTASLATICVIGEVISVIVLGVCGTLDGLFLPLRRKSPTNDLDVLRSPYFFRRLPCGTFFS